MKSITQLCLCLLISLGLLNCEPASSEATTTTPETTSVETLEFDSLLAAEYGADDYGMKKYVLAFLYRGPNRDLPEAEAKELQAAHMANIGAMAEAGKLVLAGPFLGDGDLRGIYVFDVPTIAEAEALTNTDPAIQANSLRMELMEWYGSAGLKGLNDLHMRISKVKM